MYQLRIFSFKFQYPFYQIDVRATEILSHKNEMEKGTALTLFGL